MAKCSRCTPYVACLPPRASSTGTSFSTSESPATAVPTVFSTPVACFFSPGLSASGVSSGGAQGVSARGRKEREGKERGRGGWGPPPPPPPQRTSRARALSTLTPHPPTDEKRKGKKKGFATFEAEELEGGRGDLEDAEEELNGVRVQLLLHELP
eukprot:3590320-Rhodomonas_salina.1